MISAARARSPDTDFGATGQLTAFQSPRFRIDPTPADDSPYVKLEIVTQRQDFDALEAEWSALYDRAGRPGNPFQSFAWCWHWANHFLKGRDATTEKSELFILTGRTGARLTMIWPMVRERSRGLRTLTWLGAPVTQYGDVLVEGGDKLRMLREAWQFLRSNANADIIALYKVREDAAVAPLLAEIGAVATHKDRAPYVDMSQSETFEDYADKRYSKKRKSYLRRYRRRFEDIAPVRTDVLSEGQEARAVTDELLRFKQEWLTRKSMVSRALHDPRTRDFFLDTVTDTTRRTGCRITTMRCGEELVGAKLNYVAKGRAVAHVITYNLAYDKWNPGHLTTYAGLEACKKHGIDVFDFMGPCAPFKLDWADDSVEVNDWAVPLSMKGSLWTRVYLGYARDRLKAAHMALPASLKRLTSPMLSTILMVA